MEQIAESGIAIELSTAGLRKPVGEIYPDRAFLEMVVDAGNPIALSSDAHTPEQLGFEYEQAMELLSDVGVTEIAVFEHRDVHAGADRPVMSARPHRHRLGLAPARRRPPADPRRRDASRYEHGLDGHSDADVLTHAVIDALLGAAGLDDIGALFPDTDAAYKDADSLALLRDVVGRVRRRGLRGRPRRHDGRHGAPEARAAPRRDPRRAGRGAGRRARRDVNVKASTGEGIGFVGRGEGVAALGGRDAQRAVVVCCSPRCTASSSSSRSCSGAGAFLLLADRTQIPYPILLVVGGTALAFVPGVSEFVLDPDIVLVAFLPPLLYGAAFFTSMQDLRANYKPIGLLAVGLVASTTVTVAVVAHDVVGLPWAAAFVLGAIVSPTDPVAADRDRRPLARAAAAGDDRRGRVAHQRLDRPHRLQVRDRRGADGDVLARSARSASSCWSAVAGVAIGLAVGWAVGELRRAWTTRRPRPRSRC